MKESLYERMGELLKTREEYRSEEGELLKARVYSDSMTMDKQLISLLLSDEEVKEAFFVKVDDTLVFDKQKFAWIIDSKEFLPDSYTAYTNKIGLTSDGEFISNRNDVVLDFPYKDCILEGGQDKDDQKRKEIFYNETLAQDEIRGMLDPKVFTKAKRYTKDGVEENITFDEKDNMIIKGNNLIALSSLLERYEGKVKCIYIDPPYNTGSDSFNYNDSFNHSTWLTFMKNRLELAKKLLKEDGVIFVQCDDNEQAYLKVLMDEVFRRDNFINLITIETKIGGVSGSSEGKSLRDATEYINIFALDKSYVELNKVNINLPLYEHIQSYIDSGKSWKYTSIITKLGGKKKIREEKDFVFYSYDEFESMSIRQFAEKENMTEKEVYENFANRIFRTTNAQSSVRQYVEDQTKDIDSVIIGLEYKPIKGKSKDKLIEILYKDSKRNMVMFLSDVTINIASKYFYQEGVTTLWNDILYNNLSSEGDVKFNNGKKPEKLLERIIQLTTNESDLILDFHLGSGTTAAVAHKMGRQYIGIEQMDYIEDITVERLKKVIDGEQGGISKAVDWQGGGSFVYCELLENGNELIRVIENANENTIEDVKAKIYKDERIVPYIITEELEKVDTEFEELTLEDKKKALIKLVDKNKLYVNYSDMDNADYAIPEADKKFTKSFYEVD